MNLLRRKQEERNGVWVPSLEESSVSVPRETELTELKPKEGVFFYFKHSFVIFLIMIKSFSTAGIITALLIGSTDLAGQTVEAFVSINSTVTSYWVLIFVLLGILALILNIKEYNK